MRSVVFVLACACVLSACGPSSTVTTPDGFLSLPEASLEWRPYHYKALSPDGATIVVREHDHAEVKGSLEYWTEALTREIQAEKGYVLTEAADVEAGGMAGSLLRFDALYGGEEYRYDVALFVTNDLIVTVETAGSAEQYERYAEEFAAAVRSLRLE
jgi:hypothetical protein